MNIFLEKFIDIVFNKPAKALDLGAGKFTDIEGLKQKGWECEGVDLNTGIDLELPYLSKNAPFDLVFSNYVLHELKNKENLIQTAFDNLKNGGWFFIHTFDRSDSNSKSNITINLLKNLLEKRGFKSITARIFDYYDSEEGHKHWHKILEVIGQK